LQRAAQLLASGASLAIKGIGGYHLACDARHAEAVANLRERKYRKEKPFAIMVRDLREAACYVYLSDTHQQLLGDCARPVVLAEARQSLPGVAPDNSDLGVMLPYAPLHHLLFEYGAPSPLVMTSGNQSNEPIAFRDEDAVERLADLSDAMLIGDRPIARRLDDSVATVHLGKPLYIRRSRGYAPAIVACLPVDTPLLALGGDLKNTIALVVDSQVLVSQHIGDLAYLETQQAFHEAVHDLMKMYDLLPGDVTVVHDLHPEFHSTRFARTFPARCHVPVQHHHAHIASVLAEHDCLDEGVIGVALDGTGYGTDGTIWGGEFFVGSPRDGFQRAASLRPVNMPGGDAAARFPVQAAAAFLAELEVDPRQLMQAPFHLPARFRQSLELVNNNVRCFPSTSAGRLFDAVAALLGFVRESTFEGQAAIWLEMHARRSRQARKYSLANLDHRPLLSAIIKDRLAGHAINEIALGFHHALADEVARQIAGLGESHQISIAAVSGGVFQNKLLFERLHLQMQKSGACQLITNHIVPVNDGGLCLGQAAIAAVEAGLKT
jgi:hydrogenase maturation protein HypF